MATLGATGQAKLARALFAHIVSMDTIHRKKLHHINLPGYAYELTFSCYRRLPLLSRDRTCQWLIEAFEASRPKHRYALLAFVIMPEHVHMIVYPKDAEYAIAGFLKSIK